MHSDTTLYRTTRFVWYVLYVIEAILAIRFTLKLLAANPGAGFTQLVYGTSEVFLAPFRYVFDAPTVNGSVIEFSTILAMLVYWLLAWGIVKLVAMGRDVNQHEAHAALEDQDNS